MISVNLRMRAPGFVGVEGVYAARWGKQVGGVGMTDGCVLA